MCDKCNVLYINGIKCHEMACPDKWKDYLKECVWCGEMFTPEYKHQQTCSEDCYEAYNN